MLLITDLTPAANWQTDTSTTSERPTDRPYGTHVIN